MDYRAKDHNPGDRVCVRTRYGWEFEGELQMSDADSVRIFDPVIKEVVRLGHDDVVELTPVNEPGGKDP